MKTAWLWVAVFFVFLLNIFVYYVAFEFKAVHDTPDIAQTALPTDSSDQSSLPPERQIVHAVAVPILMYHYIRDYTNQADPAGVDLSVSPTNFQKQLEALKAAGYHTISLTDFANAHYDNKSVVLTFDDGYDDHFTAALPILQREQMTGTFFIIHNFIGRKGYMTADQLSQLQAAGMELGGHTLDHKDLAVLPYAEAYRQIAGSLTGDIAPVFDYPSGEYNLTTVNIVKNLGVRVAVTTKLGIATDLSDPYLLPRLRVRNNTDIMKLINDQLAMLKKVEQTPKPPQSTSTSR